tara:strand:+ start:96 stop:476 length:381 start_codon:yes stop_codon:yes gene_type:complete
MIIKIKNVYGLIKLYHLIVFFLFIIIFPIDAYSAELLQINDINTILVGDQNRSLYLSLYCVDISEKDEEKATELLKSNFPRGTKVKIKPYGSNGSRLMAKVFKVDGEIEMTELLNTFNSSKKNCIN